VDIWLHYPLQRIQDIDKFSQKDKELVFEFLIFLREFVNILDALKGVM
jgi:hypothetical protein